MVHVCPALPIMEVAVQNAVVPANADADVEANAADAKVALAAAIKENIQINYCILPMMPGWKF